MFAGSNMGVNPSGCTETRTNSLFQKKLASCFPSFATGHHDAVELLLDEGNGQINALDGERNTPLHLAAGMGHEKVANAIVERGGSLNLRNVEGQTPRQLALANGHTKLARTLERLGAL